MAKLSINDQVNKILVENGLDFTIEKEELKGVTSGRETPYFGLYNSKTGECINSVKKGYTISQNHDIVRLVLEGVKEFGDTLRVVKAGQIKGGSRVYIQLEISGLSKVGKSEIKKYVTVIDSNDGTTGLSVGIGDHTFGCENQFYKFYKKGQSKFRHTASITERMAEIPQLVELALQESMNLIKVYRHFLSTPLTKKLSENFLKEVMKYDKLLSMEEIKEKLSVNGKGLSNLQSLENMITLETADKGMNLWGLHSGVTRWTTHSKKGPKRDNGFIESMLTGNSYNINNRSYNFAVRESGIIVNNEDLIYNN